ncbi:hypothetical protein Kpol_1033p36 [Vanderwaltozyma polyspora DSM 70294]|uniref:FHA domain-containing protein n=1 Tax=Vanderwaltozyma polyspora (strain ATCC 22028 / DSM 70294 / BCRC 21397 / CBS 2163 / NBRC 10782 / NRRL Y-8283 / UCD 57-17) TaxID=436907 RepID=A7TJ32_VANPO|nr:uncharacterized protein Kpol_1033p36 [Vanderwaltozyma polyspora DSM 70294]EDO17731.1 hypothetical protein Kpol_1033p36 [Vanderwaltozyma polyspora DSM 70294]
MMEQIRSVVFSFDDAKSSGGVCWPIGRASDKDTLRRASKDNLYFKNKSLSKKHALLCIKLLEPIRDDIHIIDQFRIYIKDLDSTYGIVDLNSIYNTNAKIIDLKNGERFGLIQIDDSNRPSSSQHHHRHHHHHHQNEDARLKFQVNIQYHDVENKTFECIVRDVSFGGTSVVAKSPPISEESLDESCKESSSVASTNETFQIEDYNYIDLITEDDVNIIDTDEKYSEVVIDEVSCFEKKIDSGETENSNNNFNNNEYDNDKSNDNYNDNDSGNGKSREEFTLVSYSSENIVSPKDSKNSNFYVSDSEDSYEYIASLMNNESPILSVDCSSSSSSLNYNGNKRSISNECEYTGSGDRSIGYAIKKRAKPNNTILNVKREVLISGLVGFTIGSLSTLGILVGIANSIEGSGN